MNVREIIKASKGLPTDDRTALLAGNLSHSVPPVKNINMLKQVSDASWSKGYIRGDGGIQSDREDFRYSEMVPVSSGKRYILSYRASKYDSECSWYDGSKTFIRTDELINTANSVSYYDAPENARYVIVSIPTATSYLILAEDKDINVLPQPQYPIAQDSPWQYGWYKRDGTVDPSEWFIRYTDYIDVSELSKIRLHKYKVSGASNYFEIAEYDAEKRQIKYIDEESANVFDYSFQSGTKYIRFSAAKSDYLIFIKDYEYTEPI